jgi:hypothetical protein
MKKLVLIVLVLVICVSFSFAKETKWKTLNTGTIVDVDPILLLNGTWTFMIHYDNKYWNMIEYKDFDGRHIPCIGEYGAMYKNGDEKYKWEIQKNKPRRSKRNKKVNEPNEPNEPNAILPQLEITENVTKDWNKASSKFPQEEKTVLVRFDDGRTSTAYLTRDKEWKLDIDREKYRGGKTITNIKEWKDIDL